MHYIKVLVYLVVLCLVNVSCSPEKETEKKEVPPPENKITDSTSFANNVYDFDNVSGPAGVLDFPEMLVLSILDSANKNGVSSAMVKNYALLEEEMNLVGAEINGPVGMLVYNNDVHNFVFENILPIKRIPKTQPKKCKIVVLEASKMLVYNFYGSYQNLFAAYDKIKKYCDKKDLLQSGPMREFYITDPEVEKNPEKWLTRIMVPVVSMYKE